MISKIHIIGGPGSGKSYLATRLKTVLEAGIHDLDDLFWDNKADSYGTRAPAEIRDRRLREILLLPKWIIEGVYYQWVQESFSKADLIVVLRPNVNIRDWRIMKRFVKRKLGLIRSKRETFKDFINLIKWNHGYDSDNLHRAMNILEKYKDKTINCKCADEAFAHISIMIRSTNTTNNE